MGYIGVDIHENIVVAGAGFNEKGFFNVDLASRAEVVDLFAAMDEGISTETDSGSIGIFKVTTTGYNDKVLTAAEIGTELTELKNKFVDILKTQMPEAQAKKSMSAAVMFQGLGIVPGDQTLAAKLLNQDFLDQVFSNIVNGFVAAMTPFFGKNPFRVKLSRQSVKKHYPTFPKRGKGFTPWIESMQIPKEQSKIEWSKYELEKGLNSGAKQEADQADPAAAAAVTSMFGAPAVADPIPATANPVTQPVAAQPMDQSTAVNTSVQQPAAQPVVSQQATPVDVQAQAVVQSNPFAQ